MTSHFNNHKKTDSQQYRGVVNAYNEGKYNIFFYASSVGEGAENSNDYDEIFLVSVISKVRVGCTYGIYLRNQA